MDLSIVSSICISNDSCYKDNQAVMPTEVYKGIETPEDLYRYHKYNYMKFFKMDLLSKWAWVGAEMLVNNNELLLNNVDKNKVAIVLMTCHGCIDVDKKYLKTTETIPSPALFVYTLPNIMLGEICIRHGFKGEQMSLVSDSLDVNELHYYVNDLLQNRGMDACLMGWVDAYENSKKVVLYWIGKGVAGLDFTTENITEIYTRS